MKPLKVFSLTEESIDDCVLPDQLNRWFKIIKPRWFVIEDTEEAKREPGKIEIEK